MPIPKARKGESKQSYLRRCTDALMQGGCDAQRAFSECALACREQNLADDGAEVQRLAAASFTILEAPDGGGLDRQRYAFLCMGNEAGLRSGFGLHRRRLPACAFLFLKSISAGSKSST
jgi:hypothetical protein